MCMCARIGEKEDEEGKRGSPAQLVTPRYLLTQKMVPTIVSPLCDTNMIHIPVL